MVGLIRVMMKHEWICFLLTAVVLLRTPTLLEPYWYGDEGIYLTIGHAMHSGEQLYKDIHDNKPPLIYTVAAVVDGNQFWYRFVAAGVNILTVFLFGLTAKKVLTDKRWGVIIISWLFALLTNLPFWEGNIGNAENFFLLFTVAAAYLIVSAPAGSTKAAWWAGIFIGIGGLFKIPALLEVGVWPLIWLATREKKWFKNSFVHGVAAVLPFLLSLIYFTLQGTLKNYLIAAGLQNAGYVSSWGAQYGIYSLTTRVVLAVILVAILIAGAIKLGKRATWIGVWLVVTLFAALMSNRPYPHYLLQVTPPLALAAGLLGWGKVKERTAGLVGIIMVATIFVGWPFWAYSTVGYYRNFVSWVAGAKNTNQYYAWFNGQVNENYLTAKQIRETTSETDKIFVWGDEPVIYALAKRNPVGRYTSKYHVLDFKAQQETMQKLQTEMPKVIVSFGEEDKLPGLGGLLETNYTSVYMLGNGKMYRKL